MVQSTLKEHLTQTVVNVVGGGDQEWALVELEANAVCKNGMSLRFWYTTASALQSCRPTLVFASLTFAAGMKYPQRYAWVMRFNDSGVITQVWPAETCDECRMCS